MSNALIMAIVTVILKSRLENSLISQAVTTGMGDVAVTALPPDRIAIGADERPQLNLYLYRLTPNTGWRPTKPAQAQSKQALALDLHYLLSAYGERDFQAEILLGAAIECLQTSSEIQGEQIRATLASLTSTKSGNAMLKALVQATQAGQVAQIRVRPEFLSQEEQGKLWSSFQAHARLSVTYQVSVTLHIIHNDAAMQAAHTSRQEES